MELRPILEVCDREKCYEGGGRRRELWWRQTADQKYLCATLKDISLDARARRWEYGRRGEVGGGREVAESDAGSDGPLYAGTQIGDPRVGEWSCVET